MRISLKNTLHCHNYKFPLKVRKNQYNNISFTALFQPLSRRQNEEFNSVMGI